MKLKLSKEFKIGFFGILMIGALYWGVNFLKGTDLLTSTDRFYAVYDQVNGLQSSASVLIKGFKVGSISKISYDPTQSKNVVVEFAIKSKYKIPEDSKARIFSDGIMSGKSVELELGQSTKYLHQGDTLFSEINKDFLEVAGSEFEFMKQRANDVINELMVTLKHVNTLMADNKESLNSSFRNIASITHNVDQLVANEQGNVHEILYNLNTLTNNLNSKSGQIDRIISNVENFSDSLSQSPIPTMITQMTTTLSQLNVTLEQVNSGKGTVGKFIHDQALYDSLVSTSSNLAALLQDLKTRPSRYINVSVFGRRDRE